MAKYLTEGVVIIASMLCVCARSTVLLYTDLIHLIAKDGNCSALAITGNVSSTEKLQYAAQSVSLMQFSFSKITLSFGNQQTCEREDISTTHFHSYTWVCFSTGNGSEILRDTNWAFLDCKAVRFISVACLANNTLHDIKNKLCNSGSLNDKCLTFSSDIDGTNQKCSKNFAVKSIQVEDGSQKGTFLSSFDIVAILCAIFIITCFILAISIPAQRCKPSYKYEKEAERRVPLEIYELYGANYMPSAKRQLTANADHWKTREYQQTQHSRNVALVASVEENISYTRRESKRQRKKHSSKHVTIASDITLIDDQGKRLDEDNLDELSVRNLNDIQKKKSLQVHIGNMLDETRKAKHFNPKSTDCQPAVGVENADGINITAKRRSSTC